MRYMFVVAHPDDEVFGAGALIDKLIKNGDDVLVVILNAFYEKSRNNMRFDIEESHKILGVKNAVLLKYTNMEFYRENHRAMVEDIEKAIQDFEPDYIFTHSKKDLHPDHAVVSKCCDVASRLRQRHNSGHRIKALYYFEVPSSSDWATIPFAPDTFVEVSKENLYAKVKSVNVYQNVLRDEPHPRRQENMFAWATVRGSQAGFIYAEAFETAWRTEL